MRRDQTAGSLLKRLSDRIQSDPVAKHRLQNWHSVIEWQIDGHSFLWRIEQGKVATCDGKKPTLTLKCATETLQKIVDRELPFFIALWATAEVEFEGAFGDAYRVGYLLLNDKRARRIIFIAHCWLNMNTRFPEGCGFAGANVPLVEALLDNGLGIVQMPCPECLCLGLEKERWGANSDQDIRACFHGVAEGVVDQLQLYQSYGYEIAGILGMNPSPSCGVDAAKGKGTMLGINRDTSEVAEPGVFIEEIQKLIKERGLESPPFFAVRRTLPGEAGLDEKIAELKMKFKKNPAAG